MSSFLENVKKLSEHHPELYQAELAKYFAEHPEEKHLLTFYLENEDKPIPSQFLRWKMLLRNDGKNMPHHLVFRSSSSEYQVSFPEVVMSTFNLVSLLDFPTIEISFFMFSNGEETERAGSVKYYPSAEARTNYDLFAQEFQRVAEQPFPFSDPETLSARFSYHYESVSVRVYDIPEHIVRLAGNRQTKRFADLELNGVARVEGAERIYRGKTYVGGKTVLITRSNPDGGVEYVKRKNRNIYQNLRDAVESGVVSLNTLARYEIMTQLGGEAL